MSMYIGEALVGDGNEVAHIDLLIGSKNGPVGVAFANAIPAPPIVPATNNVPSAAISLCVGFLMDRYSSLNESAARLMTPP